METIRILVTTDFHSSRQALVGLDRLLSKQPYDGVIMAGDLINPPERELRYAKDFVGLVKKTHHLPLFGLHGNNEPEIAWRYYREADINIHLQTREFLGYNICGIGGLGYLNEPGFEDLSIDNLLVNEKTIFVTHVPPRASVVPEKGPLVHLFGHLHVQAYTKKVGQTLLVQCPAGLKLQATEIELPSLRVNFIDL